MVLAGLVLVLIYQVYKVKFAPPEAEEEGVIFVPPSGTMSNFDIELPPPPPPDPDRPDTKRLVRSNPFSAIGLGQGGTGSDGEKRPDLELIKIIPYTGGTYVAQIRTQTARPKLYGIGEQFESYRIISIDPTAQEVVIYSEEHRKNFTYTPEDG